MFKSVLVVCIGNICRSPMGEAVLKDALQKAGKDVRVESAGLAALRGSPADATSVLLMKERGIDLTGHVARQLSPQMLRDFELILVMETAHKRTLEAEFPQARGRVKRFGEWSDFDIPDPYRKPRAAFEHALSLIDRGVEDLRSRIFR